MLLPVTTKLALSVALIPCAQNLLVSDKQYMHLLLRSMIHTKLKLLETYTKSVRPTYVLEQHFGIPHEGEHVSREACGPPRTFL